MRPRRRHRGTGSSLPSNSRGLCSSASISPTVPAPSTAAQRPRSLSHHCGRCLGFPGLQYSISWAHQGLSFNLHHLEHALAHSQELLLSCLARYLQPPNGNGVCLFELCPPWEPGCAAWGHRERDLSHFSHHDGGGSSVPSTWVCDVLRPGACTSMAQVTQPHCGSWASRAPVGAAWCRLGIAGGHLGVVFPVFSPSQLRAVEQLVPVFPGSGRCPFAR